ncbi:MAG: pilus assembly FimT family protein [Burkholderiaceae bacterium]|jgi:general secretion pathway protein H
MPTSVPGSKPSARKGHQAGFTLLELLVVITIIALATGLAVLALRDPGRSRLEQEAARLAAVLDAARVESRTTGAVLTWQPLPGSPGAEGRGADPARADFVFEPRSALPPQWPHRWLHAETRAEVIGTPRLVLGPEPLIPAQRVRLSLGDQQIVLTTDGLHGFSVEDRR